MIKEIITDRKLLVGVISDELVDGDDLTDIIRDLIDTASQDFEGTAGLAAPQIGYNKRVILVKINNQFIPMLNPVIVKRWPGSVSKLEKCLSVPVSMGEGKGIKISRHKRIRVEFNDYRDGNRIQFNFKGFTARVIQHEIAHLDGKLI